MLTRVLAACLIAAVTGSTAARAGAGGKDVQQGEILGVDQPGRAVTVRVVRLDQNETHVFQIVDATTIRDKATGRRMGLADLRSGHRVTVTGRRQNGRRVAIEIVVKPEKKGRDRP